MDITDRFYHSSLRRILAKRRKPILWNDIEFESAEKLRGHLRLANVGLVYSRIKKEQKLNGHIPVYIKGGKNE